MVHGFENQFQLKKVHLESRNNSAHNGVCPMFLSLRKKEILMLSLFLWTFRIFAGDFIQGIYAVPVNETDIAKAKELGFTYMHCYLNPYTKEGHATAQKQLELAEKYKMKVAFDLFTRVLIGKKEALTELTRIVRDFKNHPALGAWYLYDEPSSKEMKHDLWIFYSTVKRETPDIPILLCLAQNESWRTFIKPCDILMGDNYPVRDEPFPEAPLHYFTNFLHDISRCNKSFIAIPQLMCWSSYPDRVKEFNQHELRYPNETEIRCFFYAPLAMGNMKGAFWYSYYDIFYRGRQDGRKNSDFIKKIAPLIHEFRDFVSLLKDPSHPRVFQWAEGNQFQMALFDGINGKQYLVLVNLWPLKRRFDRWTERILSDGRNLKPWRFTRNIQAETLNGKFVLENPWINPWETIIWEVEKL